MTAENHVLLTCSLLALALVAVPLLLVSKVKRKIQNRV